MDETKFDEEFLEYLIKIKPDIDEHFLWDKHFSCFPKTTEGKYAVHTDKSAKPEYVESGDIVNYPWIGINYFYAEDYGDELEKMYEGVNDFGVALVVFDSSEPLRSGKTIELRPTIICQYEKTTHYIYRLKNFFPRRTSKLAKKTFGHTINTFESATGATQVYGHPILNPFCPKVKVIDHTDKTFTFEDLRSVDNPTEDEIRRRRKEGKRKQAEAGKKVALARKNKSIDKICNAIMGMKLKGMDFTNKSKVAEFSGVNRRTVLRNWDADEIQKLL